MPKFTINNTGAYNPFNYLEILQPMMWQTEQHNKLADDITKAQEDAAFWETLAESSKDLDVYNIYKNFAGKLESAAGELAATGLSPLLLNQFRLLRVDYARDLKPYEAAYQSRNDWAKAQASMAMQNPDYIAAASYLDYALKDFMNGQTPDIASARGKDVREQAEKNAQTWSSVTFGGPVMKTIKNIWEQVLTTEGVTSTKEAFRRTMEYATKSDGPLAHLADQIRQEYRYDEYSPEDKERFDSFLYDGFWDGLKGNKSFQFLTYPTSGGSGGGAPNIPDNGITEQDLGADTEEEKNAFDEIPGTSRLDKIIESVNIAHRDRNQVAGSLITNNIFEEAGAANPEDRLLIVQRILQNKLENDNTLSVREKSVYKTQLKLIENELEKIAPYKAQYASILYALNNGEAGHTIGQRETDFINSLHHNTRALARSRYTIDYAQNQGFYDDKLTSAIALAIDIHEQKDVGIFKEKNGKISDKSITEKEAKDISNSGSNLHWVVSPNQGIGFVDREKAQTYFIKGNPKLDAFSDVMKTMTDAAYFDNRLLANPKNQLKGTAANFMPTSVSTSEIESSINQVLQSAMASYLESNPTASFEELQYIAQGNEAQTFSSIMKQSKIQPMYKDNNVAVYELHDTNSLNLIRYIVPNKGGAIMRVDMADIIDPQNPSQLFSEQFNRFINYTLLSL